MPATSVEKNNKSDIVVINKMKNYSQEPVFKKKTEKASAFIKKNGLPASFTENKK